MLNWFLQLEDLFGSQFLPWGNVQSDTYLQKKYQHQEPFFSSKKVHLVTVSKLLAKALILGLSSVKIEPNMS